MSQWQVARCIRDELLVTLSGTFKEGRMDASSSAQKSCKYGYNGQTPDGSAVNKWGWISG